jgi:DNA-binding NarL/FixJ family response regulator
VVDDHPDVRTGLRALIQPTKDLKICGEAKNAEEALRKACELEPDLAIVDVSLKDKIDGIELTRLLRQRLPGLRVLVLSLYEDRKYQTSALQAGAQAWVSKTASSERLLKALREIARSDRSAQSSSSPSRQARASALKSAR